MSIKREIAKLTAIRCLRSFMIFIPVIGLYFLEHDLSVRDIFVLQVIFSVAMVAFEVPSGYFADVVGRKHSIVIGTIFAALGYLTYGLASGFGEFVCAEILLAFAVSFVSGADSAFLYDLLKEEHLEETYLKHTGKMFGLSTFSEAIASLCAGVLVVYLALADLFFVQFGLTLITIALALSLHEPRRADAGSRITIVEVVRFATRENIVLQRLNLFSGAVSAATLTMVWFAQPYWASQDIDAAYFGVMWAGLLLLVSISSLGAPHLEKYLRFRTLFGVIGVTAFISYVLLGMFAGTTLALFVIPIFWVLRGIHAPIVSDYLNRETGSEMRATVLSINQLCGRLIFSVFTPFLGWIADIWSYQMAFFASAMSLGILAFAGFLLWYAAIERRRLAEI